jgi:hypothetical protein
LPASVLAKSLPVRSIIVLVELPIVASTSTSDPAWRVKLTLV